MLRHAFHRPRSHRASRARRQKQVPGRVPSPPGLDGDATLRSAGLSPQSAAFPDDDAKPAIPPRATVMHSAPLSGMPLADVAKNAGNRGLFPTRNFERREQALRFAGYETGAD